MLRHIVLKNIPIAYNIQKTPYVNDFSLQLTERKRGDLMREWAGTSFLNAEYLSEFLYISKINPTDISNYDSLSPDIFSHFENLHSLKSSYINSLQAKSRHVLDLKNFASVYTVFQKHKPVEYISLDLVKSNLEMCEYANNVVIVEFNFFKLSWLNKIINTYRDIFKDLTGNGEIHFISPKTGQLIRSIDLKASLLRLDRTNQDLISGMIKDAQNITEFKFVLAEFNITNNSSKSFMFDTPEKYSLVKQVDFYISSDYGVLDKTLSFIKGGRIKYE